MDLGEHPHLGRTARPAELPGQRLSGIPHRHPGPAGGPEAARAVARSPLGRQDPGMLSVRDAWPGEARAIAEVHVLSWRAAYRGLLPADVLDGLSVDGRERMWAGILRDPAPRRAVLVAAEEDKVLGFAALGPSRVAELAVQAGTTEGISEEIAEEIETVDATVAQTGLETETGELYALYLHPD